jgi:hypothetical protein
VPRGLTTADLLAPLRPPSALADADQRTLLASLLFPPPSQDQVAQLLAHVLPSRDWLARGIGDRQKKDAEDLAHEIAAGMSQGMSQRAIAKAARPYLDGSRVRAARAARTFGVYIAGQMQERCHHQAQHLFAGQQVHASLDEHTRPLHRHRNGTIYWYEPRPGQEGMDKCPHPPREADGSLAWNCRCFLTPVLKPPADLVADPQRMAALEKGAAALAPDHAVYSDWWASADERRKRLAVGSRRYDAAAKALDGGAPSWEQFVDPKTGKRLSIGRLSTESPRQREKRIDKVRREVAVRKEMLRLTRTYGFVPPPDELPPAPDPRQPLDKPIRRESAGLVVEHAAGVTGAQAQVVNAAVDALPERVRRLTAAKGYRVRSARRILEVRPDLEGSRPRGYPEGWTWDHTDGFHDARHKEIMVSEERRSRHGDQYEPSGRSPSVFRHEMGHALDASLGYWSNSPEFRTAYERDAAKVRARADATLYGYYLQESIAGPSEVFAESFAQLHGGGADAGLTPIQWEQMWPEVSRVIRAKVAELPEVEP